MRRWIVGGIAGLAVAGTIAGGAVAAAGSDGEGGVTGPQADRAVRAALDATGGGTANAVERDGEGGAVGEVEVRTPDGALVDVRHDETFSVVAVEGDSETADAGDGGA